jgi:predicted transcriptional regulator
VGVRVSEELKQDLQQIAAAETRTVSQICELLLASGIKQYKRTKNLDFVRDKH